MGTMQADAKALLRPRLATSSEPAPAWPAWLGRSLDTVALLGGARPRPGPAADPARP